MSENNLIIRDINTVFQKHINNVANVFTEDQIRYDIYSVLNNWYIEFYTHEISISKKYDSYLFTYSLDIRFDEELGNRIRRKYPEYYI